MKYMAEDSQNLIRELGDRLAGPSLSRGIARLYSQHTRLRADSSGLPSWTEQELLSRLNEGERLLVAGMATDNNEDRRRYLRRAGEIFEWSATIVPNDIPVPAVLLAASAYQLAGYPARASGILSEYHLPSQTSKILTAILRADFPAAQTLLLETWQRSYENIAVEDELSSKLLDNILRSMGILISWLRLGDEPRIDRALNVLESLSSALRYDIDRFSWLLSVIFEAIAKSYRDDALWTVLLPFKEVVNRDGWDALNRYARVAFLEKKALTWPSQRAGINGIMSCGSFALCTPTGSGKTRVAEIVILKHLFSSLDHEDNEREPLILYLAPSRALSAEVEAGLARSLRSIRAHTVTVTSLYGGNDFGPSDLISTGDEPTVLISTHEKADALLRFLGPDLLRQLSCVIIDEAHTVSFTGRIESLVKAQSRSLRLEGLVSRMKSLCRPTTSFVALSAVAAELRDTLSDWMSGKEGTSAIATTYRSTRQLFGQLQCLSNGQMRIQYDVLDGQLLLVENKESAPYVPSPFPPHPQTPNAFRPKDSVEKRMRAHLLWAAMHFAQHADGKGHSVLISVTEHPEYYAGTFLDLLENDWASAQCPVFFSEPKEPQQQELLERCLASCADYFGQDSREYRLLKRGIVLHHGKMPPVMPRLLIELIQSHVVSIVIATSTLSEGVNLPFETVLIPCLLRIGSEVAPKEIINVAGRAGRAGVSTEGRTLVLLPSSSRKFKQQSAYDQIVAAMINQVSEPAATHHSPLYRLIIYIAEEWSLINGSKDNRELIHWLETTPYFAMDDEQGRLMQALDSLDQQLLASIEEAESLLPGTSLEEYLQLLWRHTLAHHEDNQNNKLANQMFVRRGIALTKTIYPERTQRRALYQTGLPPRDGHALIEKLPIIKKILLQEATEYATWSDVERIQHLEGIIDVISDIEAFAVGHLNIGRAKMSWNEIFAWWMAPNVAPRSPTPSSVSKWYNFAAKYFIYGLNWALGSVIGSILERDGGKGDLRKRWQRAELPWSVMWYKDMVSWGTLDPVTSYILSRKCAYTRSQANDIAAEYWERIGNIDDSSLDPRRIAHWLEMRSASGAGDEEKPSLPYSIDAEPTSECDGYDGPGLRVLPVNGQNFIDWFDPAGYHLARSCGAELWLEVDLLRYDFWLNPVKRTVVWKTYL